MATSLKNLSEINTSDVKDVSGFKFAIIVSEWNDTVTEALYEAAYATLKQAGVPVDHMERINVPGSFELPLAAQWQAARADIDAVICLGCVIQGETRHFEFICDAVAQGITQVGLKFSKPVVFGVLTTDNLQQAIDRSGGKHGNKGDEAAITALKMLMIKPI